MLKCNSFLYARIIFSFATQSFVGIVGNNLVFGLLLVGPEESNGSKPIYMLYFCLGLFEILRLNTF